MPKSRVSYKVDKLIKQGYTRAKALSVAKKLDSEGRLGPRGGMIAKRRRGTKKRAPPAKGVTFIWYIRDQASPAQVAEWYNNYGYVHDPRFRINGKYRASMLKSGIIRVTASVVGPSDASKIDWEMAADTLRDPDDDGNYPLNGKLVIPQLRKPSVPTTALWTTSWLVRDHKNPERVAAWYKIHAAKLNDYDPRFNLEEIEASMYKGYVKMTATIRGPTDAAASWSIAEDFVRDPDDDVNHPLDGMAVIPLPDGFTPP